ncbi:MAG: glycosyltransferase family 1 protein [Planctomycetes bacterium]|nr:glycosyltransferase family 1 protein [Planctomycetota bacterium]
MDRTAAARTPLKIALVTETFPPEINGVAMTLHRLVTALAQHHRVTVIRPRQPQDACDTRSECLPADAQELLRPGFLIPKWGFRFGFPAPLTLRRTWKADPPDLVHIATEGPLGYSALVMARRLGIPVTTSFHTNFHDYSRYYGVGLIHGLVSSYLRSFHNRGAKTLVPSRDLLQGLSADGYNNLVLFGRGVDTQLFAPTRRDPALRDAWGVGPNGLAIVHVGRVAPEKNMPLLFAAFDRIRAFRPDARLIIVGDGALRGEYQRQHPEAIFAGARIGKDLARHYASADLFLFPSMSETFGNVVLEAMASGLASVAFDYAAPQRYLRHARNGWRVAFGDETAFLATAETAAASARTLRSFGAQARIDAMDIPWDVVFAQFENAICDAVEAHRSQFALAAPQFATGVAAPDRFNAHSQDLHREFIG